MIAYYLSPVAATPEVQIATDEEKTQYNQRFASAVHAVETLDNFLERYVSLDPKLTTEAIKKIAHMVSHAFYALHRAE